MRIIFVLFISLISLNITAQNLNVEQLYNSARNHYKKGQKIDVLNACKKGLLFLEKRENKNPEFAAKFHWLKASVLLDENAKVSELKEAVKSIEKVEQIKGKDSRFYRAKILAYSFLARKLYKDNKEEAKNYALRGVKIFEIANSIDKTFEAKNRHLKKELKGFLN